MSATHNDADYANDLDHLIGAVESFEDPAQMANWGTGTMGDVIGPDQLSTHVPCLGAMRLLKTCMRSAKKNMANCQVELSEVEACSVSLCVHFL